MHEQLEKIMPARLVELLQVGNMSDDQQQALFDWVWSVFKLGQHKIAEIEAVKYDGHVVILDDGSRWEVDEIDIGTSSLWDMTDKVLVADGEMWKLDETEKVAVTEDA